MTRAAHLLRALLAVAVAESFVHYLDNTLRYEDYVSNDPSLLTKLIARWTIPVFWTLFSVAAVVAYRRFTQGRWGQAAGWLGVYSVSGLISVLHFTEISPSELSAFQNTFVWLDVALGAAVLAFAFWTATARAGPRVAPPPAMRGADER